MRKYFFFLLLMGVFVNSLLFSEPTSVTEPTSVKKQQLNSIVKRLINPKKTLSSKDWKKLEEGDVLVKKYFYDTPDGKKAGMAKGIAMFNIKPDALWNTINDYEGYKDFMPTVVGTKIIKRFSPVKIRLWHKIKIMWVKLEYVCDLTQVKFPDGSRLLQWSLVKEKGIKNDLKDTIGFWEVIPVDGGNKTILTYTAFADTGWSVPKFVQNMLANSQLPNVLRGVYKEAKKRK